MSAWLVDFNDTYPNIRSILCDEGCIVSCRSFVLIKKREETEDGKKSKCVALISINVWMEVTESDSLSN